MTLASRNQWEALASDDEDEDDDDRDDDGNDGKAVDGCAPPKLSKPTSTQQQYRWFPRIARTKWRLLLYSHCVAT